MSLLVSWDNDSLVVESIVDGDVKLRFSIEEAGDAVRKIVYVDRLPVGDQGDDNGRLVVKA